MIDDQTIRKLRQLGLSEFADALEMQEMGRDIRHLFLMNVYRSVLTTFTKKNIISE